ncbi:hypothetical protein KAR91_45250 [Candidatus Pacearchaeota archaeon]|nr:hypothetical protein [Candidatus Pacearchaeota archaeon]
MKTLITIAAICFIIRTIFYLSEKFDVRIKMKAKESKPVKRPEPIFENCRFDASGDCADMVISEGGITYMAGLAILDLETYQQLLIDAERYEYMDSLQLIIDNSKRDRFSESAYTKQGD